MVSYLSGRLVSKKPTSVVLELGGVGLEVNISVSTYELLGDTGSQTELKTYLHVKEDALELYGFATDEERSLFKTLISVSGIGPKTALAMLSGMSVSGFRSAVAKNDVDSLVGLRGVGLKTAQRLIVELKDKLGADGADVDWAEMGMDQRQSEVTEEVMTALVALGYSRKESVAAVRKARKDEPPDSSVDRLLRAALK